MRQLHSFFYHLNNLLLFILSSTNRKAVEEHKRDLQTCEYDIGKLEVLKEKREKELGALELEGKKLENKLSRYSKDRQADIKALEVIWED